MLILLVAALVVLGLLGVRILLDRGGTTFGSALDTGSGGGIVQPLPAGSALGLGIAYIENESRDEIELVSARLLRLDPDLELLGFGVLPMGPGPYGANPPITWMEYPLPGQVPLEDYPAIEPAESDEPQAKVMFGLRVRPEGAGKAVGIEVTYRQKGKLRKQVFEEQVYVCWVPVLADGAVCPGPKDSLDFFGEYEDEVKGISRYPPLSKK